jgi:hypothetical protein
MRSFILALTLTLSVMGINQVDAEEVTFEFTATVTRASDSAALTGLQVGDQISGYYTFDDTDPGAPSSTGDPAVFVYQPILDATVFLGQVTLSGLDPTGRFYTNRIVVGDERLLSNGAGEDIYDVTFAGFASGVECETTEPTAAATFILRADAPSNFIASTDLPKLPPDIALADRFNWVSVSTCRESSDRVSIEGVLTGLTLQSPQGLLEELAALVTEINASAGISKSLDTKLDAALIALDDTNENNDGAALQSMYAFCNSTEAQRGKKLTDEEADVLIEAANSIIAAIDENAPPCN